METNLSVQFDRVITDVHFTVIARDFISNWEDLLPYLGLSGPQKEEIRRTYPLYREQKHECLKQWKEKEGNKATYRAFIQAAEQAKKKGLADKVREMLQTAPRTGGNLRG